VGITSLFQQQELNRDSVSSPANLDTVASTPEGLKESYEALMSTKAGTV